MVEIFKLRERAVTDLVASSFIKALIHRRLRSNVVFGGRG